MAARLSYTTLRTWRHHNPPALNAGFVKPADSAPLCSVLSVSSYCCPLILAVPCRSSLAFSFTPMSVLFSVLWFMVGSQSRPAT